VFYGHGIPFVVIFHIQLSAMGMSLDFKSSPLTPPLKSPDISLHISLII
jgi:hypothetical protein